METKDPEKWGPPFWTVIETIADAFPENNPPAEVTNAAQMFFITLKVLLPCEKCRNHYTDYITKNPPPLIGKKELSEWVSKLRTSMTPQSVPPTLRQIHQQKIAQHQKITQQRTNNSKPFVKRIVAQQQQPPVYHYALHTQHRSVITRPPIIRPQQPRVQLQPIQLKNNIKPQTKPRVGGCNCGRK